MKKLKFLSICFALSFLFSGNAFAVDDCNTNVSDTHGPSGSAYEEGDLIEYTYKFDIAESDGCPITDIVVTFFPPEIIPDDPDPCDATNGIIIFNGGSQILTYADPAVEIDSSDPGAGSMAGSHYQDRDSRAKRRCHFFSLWYGI